MLLAGLMMTGFASAQAPPATLQYGPIDLFLAPGALVNETTDEAQNCVAVTPEQADASETFTADQHSVLVIHSEPGQFYPLGESVSVNLALQSAANPGSSSSSGQGVVITATLSWGGNSSSEGETTIAAGQQPASATVSIPLNVSEAGTGPLSLTVELAAQETGPLPGTLVDMAVVCNSENTLIPGFEYARGEIGDGDLDGDGIPNSEDPDIDGDGIPNEEEPASCTYNNEEIDFEREPTTNQGTAADHDGDTVPNQEECAQGFDPLSATSTPPPPEGFPWGLVILLIVIVVLLAAIVFLVLKFGRVADLVVVSRDELIIEAGATGKYELAAYSRRKSGDEVTLQIVVEGMPEGWDAKTDVDHVTVQPQPEDAEEPPREKFFLTVEAPEHDDPESAVVTVKAVPLNKQGRKDTFKLAAKTQTITSINVPPDAKVPVKRGGPIKLKTGEDEAEPLGIPPEGLPLTDLPGLGDATAKKLKAAGVETTEQLRTADLTDLAKTTKLDAEELGKFQQMSDLIRIPGVSPEEAQVLVENGVGSPKDLSEKKPEDIEAMFPSAAEEPDIEIQGAGA